MHPLLDIESLLQIPDFSLRAKIIAEGTLNGLHRARRYGFGSEFVEHRLYAQGDETKNIDWKVFGRFDKFYIKQREEERNFTSIIALDTSASMKYGPKGKNKHTFAIHLAAALAYLLIKEKHTVGYFRLAGEGTTHYIPPKNTQEHLQYIFNELQHSTPKNEFNPSHLFEELFERTRKKIILIVISDFLSFEPIQEENPILNPIILPPLQQFASQGNDVNAFQILSQEELSFPYHEFCEFEDLETQQKLLLDAPGIRESYQLELQNLLQRIQQQTIQSSISYHLSTTNVPLSQPLLSFFQQKIRF